MTLWRMYVRTTRWTNFLEVRLMQSFGGPWTLLKLDVLEQYFAFYKTSLKNMNFKLCYIDAFAGRGIINVRGAGEIEGSALRALNYGFSEYVFIDKEPNYLHNLEATVRQKFPMTQCRYILGDCNELIPAITKSYRWDDYWRGVIFLDPYAMNLNWSALTAIAEAKVFDVWYLFPLSALNRNLRLDGKIEEKNRLRINDRLGTDEWERQLYAPDPQLSLFGDNRLERTGFENLTPYIVKRLKTIFPGVSNRALVLRQPGNNSPLFLLCFAVSNNSRKAIQLSLRAADHILANAATRQ